MVLQASKESSIWERYDLGVLDAMMHDSKDYQGDVERLREMKRVLEGIASEADNDKFH